MTMNQESIEAELDPVDLEPITNHNFIDFVLLTRDRYAFAVIIWALLFFLWAPLGVGVAILDIFVSRKSFKRHKVEEDRMNKIKQELWKIKLTEIKLLSRY
jgi:hypothetical protein